MNRQRSLLLLQLFLQAHRGEYAAKGSMLVSMCRTSRFGGGWTGGNLCNLREWSRLVLRAFASL